MSKPTVVVSDLHLGAVPGSVGDAFVRFTQHWHGKAELLVINGDLFDFWCEFRTVVPSQHFHTLRALADLRESGVRILLIGGNHDAWGGPFLTDKVGVELADGPVELEMAGRLALVAHGDGLGPGDRGYKMLKAVVRSRPFRGFMRLIHPDVACGIASRVSRTHERQERGFAAAQSRAGVLADYAERLLRERPELDLVILGHSHTPMIKEVGENRYYVNSGDWVWNRTYTVVSEEGVVQGEWEGGGGRSDR